MTVEQVVDDFISQEQAAKMIGVTVGTLAVWRCKGRYGLRFTKSGGIVRYRKSVVLAWLESRERSSTKPANNRAASRGKEGHA